MRYSTYILIFTLGFLINVAAQNVSTSLTYSVYTPKKITGKTPVLILLHGFGSNENDLPDVGKEVAPNCIIFSLRAPNQTKNGGYCWYNLDFLPNGEFSYNYSQAKQSANIILSFISNACRAYSVDSNQVYLLGFSQGAIMSYELAVSNPKKIKGIAALSGRLMKETRQIKPDTLNLVKVKFFIAHGISDNVINVNESEKAAEFLRSKKITGLIFRKYTMQHSIIVAELNDIKNWLNNEMASVTK